MSAFAREEMVATGCDLNKHFICIFVFIFHNRPFYDVDFKIFVCQIESAPQKVWKSVSFFDFACVCFRVH